MSFETTNYRPTPLPDRREMTDAAMVEAARTHFDAMATRHSVREFCDRPVPREVIETAIATAGRAPSGANQQPWHFVAISDPDMKARIRAAAEEEERAFYGGGAPDEWIAALEPIGTGASKPHLEVAPWLIVVFAQRWGTRPDGSRYKHYYVPESVGLATGFLIGALHLSGLSVLTHTPSPMKFLTELCDRPVAEKPVMILAVGHPAEDATVPAAALNKKPLEEILTVIGAQTETT
ncbi:nitroreductase family protein [Limimaricola sp. G21655-S1]|uniref:nitroreductase family protein n=1 Tax=Limimaricola sp. G21655-S1 TaxID=3014768 RepID=UPI0022AF3F28|nr:nitroreductase family protein [Limimaricola sp. G21655-S1]MCZ4259307.1 nitroreductase family protein [Limimaricola sp. G21655-S1]